MHGRLAISVNDDGTVSIRCDADAFFANADEIRRLLTGAEAGAAPTPRPRTQRAARPARAELPAVEAPQALAPAPSGEDDAEAFRAFWRAIDPSVRASRDLSKKNTAVLAAAFYLTRERGFQTVTREDLARRVGALALDPAAADPEASSAARRVSLTNATLVHLVRRGWLERVRRGAYRPTRRALDRVASLRALEAHEPVRLHRPPTDLPRLTGLSRFLREVPTTRKWRRVLLVAYFLHEHGATPEFDARLIAACFQRARGVDAPGSLPALISQVLFKRQGLLEKAGPRGTYRLTPRALEDLRRSARVAQADAVQRAGKVRTVAKTG